MIRVTEIDALLGLVGLRQSTITKYAILDAGNMASSSGLFINDVSGLMTTKNIKECHEDPAISDANFNIFLKDRMKSSFLSLAKSIFSNDDLIENKVLFDYENDFNKLLTNATDFVGYEIDVAKTKDINVVLNKLVLTFDGIEDVKILLFHSSTNAFKDSETITTVADTDTHTTLNWDLPNANSVNGGRYYIGYLRSGLDAKAYNRDYENANVENYFNCLGIRAIQVDDWDAETLFDVNDIDYVSETWGMNFDISSLLDYTSIIIENKDRFARALQLQVAADLLNFIATSTRSNRDERIIKAEALFDLNGNRTNVDLPQSIGVLNQLKAEVSVIKRMFSEPKMQINTMS